MCYRYSRRSASYLRESKQVLEHAECVLTCERNAQDCGKRPEIPHDVGNHKIEDDVRRTDAGTRRGVAAVLYHWLEPDVTSGDWSH